MRHKKLLIGLLAIALLVGTTGAALLTYYGKIETTATVSQSVLLDGRNWDDPVTHAFEGYGGGCYCFPHTLENRGGEDVEIAFDTTFSPSGDGITVKLLKSLGYSLDVETLNAYDNYPADVSVEDVGCAIRWTFDMIGDKVLEGDGHWGYGVIISLDGSEPAFQVHGNDGTDSSYPWGTHLYSYWGPTNGFHGWYTSSRNTLVSDIDWISASGQRDIADNPSGLFTVTIDKCKLGTTFHWAVWATAGGFYSPWGGQSGYPDDFDWSTSDAVDPGVNYETATISEELTSPFTLHAAETLAFCICYEFDPLIAPGTYTIVTTFS